MGDTGRYWQRAWRYIRANQTVPARAALECVLRDAPGDTHARVLMAAICATEDRPRAAAEQVRLAAATRCTDPGVLLRLARIAMRTGETAIARSALGRRTLVDCRDAEVLLGTAEACQTVGDHRAALAWIERAVQAGADDPRLHFYRGIQLGAIGDLTGAGREFMRCTRARPPVGNAFLQLARLRSGVPGYDHLAAIRRALEMVEQGGDDHVALQFALYHELEDLRRYPEAWEALALGNRMVHARSPYAAAHEESMFARLRAICDPAFLAATARATDDGPRPIFVIGLPRSGTTVLERILGNHSRVTSAGELPAFLRALSFAADHFVPAAAPDAILLERLGAIDWSSVARRYLVQSRWRAQGKPFYVDKLPRNWMLAGLVHKALPRAPILNLVRDPMDVCFSNWRAHLGSGPDYAYAYDLGALAAHYRQYRMMLAHWHRNMPGVILDVAYARLVREPDAVVREVFAFCGLAYEAGCTELARNPSPTATLSMAEVRQPIHAHAFREWEPYADRLAGLRAALAEFTKEATS